MQMKQLEYIDQDEILCQEPEALDLERAEPSRDEVFEYAEGEEMISLRTECAKQFDLGENRFQAVVFPEPVHYREAGEWKEIDNNLDEATIEGRRVLRNRANAMLCELAARANDGPLVQLKHKGHILSWSFEHPQNAVKAQIKGGETLLREQLIQRAKQEPGNERRAADSFTDEELRNLETPESRRSDSVRRTSQVLYSDILPGVDARYTLSGDQIKEDIICKNREALALVSLKLPGSYRYVVNEDQSLSVRDPGTGAERFAFDMPVVYDAEGMTVIGRVQLTQHEGYTLMRYEVDDDFLSVCAWPVTIDPVTKPRATKKKDNMETAVVDTDGTGIKANPSKLLLKRKGAKKTVTLMRLTKLAAIKASDTVISAKLRLTVTNPAKTKGKYIGVYGMTKAWTPDGIASSDVFDGDNDLKNVTEMLDYVPCGKGKLTLDVTNLYRDWYRQETVSGTEKQSLNRGILLQLESKTGTVNLGSPKSSGSKQPQFIINYISHAGMEDWWTYENQSAGRAGVSNVDLFNGNLVHAHQDSAMTGNRMPVSIAHYYNSCQSSTDTSERKVKKGQTPWPTYQELHRCGHGWKHSGLQHIYETKVDSTNYFVWVDGDGTEHWFKKKKDKKADVYDVEGMGLKLTRHGATKKIPEKIQIEDRSHSVMTFRRRTKLRNGKWRCWWLTHVRDTMKNGSGKLTNVVNYNYVMPDTNEQQDKDELMRAVEGKLKEIKDPAGRVTVFEYYDGTVPGEPESSLGLLKEILTPDGLDGEPLSTFYFYDDKQRLTGIFYEDLLSALRGSEELPHSDLFRLLLDGELNVHTRYAYLGDTNLLISAMNYDGTTVLHGYEDSDITAASFDIPDGEDEDDDDASDEQSYDESDDDEIYGQINNDIRRVIRMETVKQNGDTIVERGAKQVFTYKNCATEVTTVESKSADAVDGKKIIYQFNDKGNVISARDELGYAQFVKYDADHENTAAAASHTQRAVINRIIRPGLMKDKGKMDPAWVTAVSGDGNKAAADKDNRCLSCHSMRMERATPGASIKFSQEVELEPNKQWTLSAYVKANAIVRRTVNGAGTQFVANDGAYMRVYPVGSPGAALQSTAISGSTEDSFDDGLATDGWERTRLSFKTDASTTKVMVEFVLDGESGKVWFAAPQIEEGLVVNPVNLLSNGDFALIREEPVVRKTNGPAKPDGHENRAWPQYWSAGKGVNKEKLNKKGTEVKTASNKEIGVFTKGGLSASDPEVTNPNDLPGNSYDPFLPVFSGNYLQLQSGVQRKAQDCYFSQTVMVGGEKNDVFYAGGWASGKAMPKSTGDVRAFRFVIQFYCKGKGGKYSWKTPKAAKHHFNSEWVGWQMQAGAAIAPQEYSMVRVVLVARGQPHFIKFTNFFLYREEFGRSYQYDKEKNVVSTTERSGQQAKMKYDPFGNMISYVKPGRPAKDNKYVLRYGNKDWQKKQHLLRSTKTPLGMISTTDYDKYGNAIAAKQKGTDTKQFIKSTTGYSWERDGETVDTQGNYPAITTDALGKSVYRRIDPSNGLLLWAYDEDKTRVDYEYDRLKRLVRVASDPAGDGKYRNEYGYDVSGRMKSVSHNTTSNEQDVVYTFDYDELGARTRVKVNGRVLSANKYKDTDRSHRLEWVEFANGGRLNYAYDDFDRVTGISFDADDPYTNPRYKYAYGANGQVAYVTDTHLQRTHWAEYDQAGRAMQSTTWDGLFDAAGPNRGNLLYRTTLKYDKSNRLVLFGEKVPGADRPKRQEKRDSKGKVVKVNGEVQYEYISDDDGTDNITTKYAYDADDRLTKITFDDKKDERSVKYEYDKLGRVSQMTVTNGGEDVPVDPDEESERDSDHVENEKSNKISYTFAKGGQGTNSQSTRITQMSHTASGILPIDYVYDTVGNITQETADLFEGGNNSYKYDKLGQLIRANVRHDPTCDTLLGTTWVYTYDRGGNIVKKEGYPYTTFTLPETPTKTIVYGYDNDGRTLPDLSIRPNWKDQLTSYGEPGNAKAIHYPQEQSDIGNPVAYDGWAFTWQAGRKLARMCKYNGEVSPAGVGAAEYGTFHVDTGDMSVAHTQGSAGHTFSLNGGDLSVNAPGYELNNGQLQASVELGDPELTIDYSYDAAGLRTQKKVTQGGVTITTDYILHGKNLMHMKKTAGGTSEQLHFYYAGGKPVMVHVGVEEADCKYYTYVYNLQGDVLGILDSDQKPVVQYRYDPWGKLLGIFGTMKDTLGKLNPFRYRGYLYDDETGLYYLRSRYYNPEWGRFVNEDSLVGKTGKLFSHNMFAYCRNNPVVRDDPDGLYDPDAADEDRKRRSIEQALRAGRSSIGNSVGVDRESDRMLLQARSEDELGLLRYYYATNGIIAGGNNPYATLCATLNAMLNTIGNLVHQAAAIELQAIMIEHESAMYFIETTLGIDLDSVVAVYKKGLSGGAGGTATGALSGILGAPFTAGASIPVSAGAGFVIGFVGGAVTEIAERLLD